ncbi:hypothetical protein [Zhongshania sp. BJYM1]|uniref:hypothetical protein n=1 Tax=Zhongshania aquatica TaxID=2965069 RepID=UPI0022B4EEAA|nr:hypothetical protein [Marortus sp. BJYM1]
MTEPTDKKPLEKLRGSVLEYDDPLQPAAEVGDWDAFFDAATQDQIGEDFVRGDQSPDQDRVVSWDEVFDSEDGADE